MNNAFEMNSRPNEVESTTSMIDRVEELFDIKSDRLRHIFNRVGQ